MYQLSVCADTVFRDLPFEERVKRIAQAGFLVEFWNWKGRNLDGLRNNPAIQVSAFTGYIGGSMVHPDGLEEFLAGVRESIPVAEKIGCCSMFLSAGQLGPLGEVRHSIAAHPVPRWVTAYKALCQIAELAEKHDLRYTLEHLNTKVEHAGFVFPKVEDVAELVTAVGSPRIRILFDVYHTQIEEGNVIEVIRRYHPLFGHVHVADVPGRHEPGTGEINYPRIAQTFREVGYEGVIGLEAFPLNSSEEALNKFREAFA